MNNIWKKYQKTWTLLIFLGIMVAAYYFGINRLLALIEEKNLKINEATALREYQQGRLKELPKYRAQQEIIDRDEARLRSLLDQSDKESVKALIESVESLAEKTACRYETVSLSEKTEVVKPGSGRRSSSKVTGIWSELPDVPYMILEIRATGPFANAYNFLRKLENMPYMLDVVGFSIVPIEKAESEASLSSDPLLVRKSSVSGGKSLKGEEVRLSASLVVYTEKKSDE